MNFMQNGCHVHFVGIGGISMSALANILKSNHVRVTGSDITESPMVKKLKANGIEVDVPHQVNLIQGQTWLFTPLQSQKTIASWFTPRNKTSPVGNVLLCWGKLWHTTPSP